MNNSNVTDDTMNVNTDDLDFTIQRCPHDVENPYTMVRNELIRDLSISPNCRWLIIYLLSNKEGWKINVKQVINHLKPHLGKYKVYKTFNEAIDAGYIKREEVKRTLPSGGELKSEVKYYVSETPKFKKSLRYPNYRDTDNWDIKNKQEYKKEHKSPQTPLKNIPVEKEPPNPQRGKPDGEVNSDQSNEKLKRSAPDFSPKVREIANNIINKVVKANPDYIPPTNLTNVLKSVKLLVDTDKREPEKIIYVLEWALADTFWSDKLMTKNPAGYLRKEFARFTEKMKNEKKPNQKIDRRLRERDGSVVDEYKDNLF